MPRDGSGIYNKPFPDVVEGTTIESAVHNGEITDIALDLNTPRPIIAGGTGANNARDAMVALGGEFAGQVVTNYDIFPFAAGSFRSAAGAVTAPTGNDFAGICYLSDPNYIVLEARDWSTGKLYVRRKTTGVWGAWAEQIGNVTDLDARYVNAAGDIMTGQLSVTSIVASPGGVWSYGSPATTGSYYFGNTGTKYLLYDGTNYSLVGGNLLHHSPAMYVGYAAGAGTTGAIQFGATGTKSLNYDGTNFTLNGGALSLGVAGAYGNLNAGDLTTSRSGAPTTGYHFFGNTGAKYLGFDGTKFLFGGGNVYHGVPNALVDAPMATGTSVSGAWAAGISAVDRGIIQLCTGASNLFEYFTVGTTSNPVGSITSNTTTTFYNTSSSAELKEDLKSFDAGNIIDNTDVYDFAWKSSGERSYGVIAQQAVEVYPMAVTHTQVETAEGDSEFWGVDYSKYVPVLLQELKALRARVADLEGRVDLKPQRA
jgi:hypothetical protein